MDYLSILWKMTFDGCLFVGHIPSPLMTESIIRFGFSTIQSHVWSILVITFSSTSKYPQYCSHCYAMLANISENNKDNQLVLNRVVTVTDDNFGILLVRVNLESAHLEFLDNNKIIVFIIVNLMIP